ncbi:MAG: hypothetical protein M1840_003930 [Geoglossum simile]|nr:MAG: hypothetical protein M1840_003930 [Geoglossum simile]
MSFINSLIARYAGGEPSSSPVSTLNRARSPEGVQQSLRSVPTSDVSAKANGVAGAGQKRRAEEELERFMAKTPKRDGSVRRPSAITDSNTTTNGLSNSTKPKIQTSSTSRPPISQSGLNTPTSVKKPQDLPAANVSKPPPKKGSYAEILARANAAQAIAAKVGIIKHKPVEGGLRKKDRKIQRRETKESSKKSAKIGTRDNKSEKPLHSGKGGEKDKSVKSNTSEPTYRGTARVKPEMPSYRGTARVNNPSPTKPSIRRENIDRYPSRSTSLNTGSSRYQHSSEEDEDDYESSDMEAAPFELEEEEHISLVTGKKEDEEALKEEMRLKKRKEERKKNQAVKRR